MKFYWLWIRRVLLSPKNIFQFSTLFSLLSLILGVASLTTALLAINGFSSGLEKAIVDMSGHIVATLNKEESEQVAKETLFDYDDLIKKQVAFLSTEAVLLKGKKFKGVLVEGIEDEYLKSSSFVQKRILKGNIQKEYKNFIIIGQSLAKDLKLKVGDFVPLIVSSDHDSYLSKKRKTFKVGAIADFGRYDFNSRYLLMSLSSSQSLIDKKVVSGVRVWLKNSDRAESLSLEINQKKNQDYNVYSWKDLDRNFFDIIEMDKKIILLVLLILILAAGFNVSSSLFVQVFKRTKDISILRSMGGKKHVIRNIFLLNGLVIGFVGTSLGMLLGWLVCFVLIQAQKQWAIIPPEIYKVNEIVLHWTRMDFFLIFFSSLFVVLLSSFLPAKKAYSLDIKEGLSYD